MTVRVGGDMCTEAGKKRAMRKIRMNQDSGTCTAERRKNSSYFTDYRILTSFPHGCQPWYLLHSLIPSLLTRIMRQDELCT